MADYTDLPNSAVGIGGIPSGTTVTALRDNPIAIAEGAVGAPRVVDAALDTGAATTAGTTWVNLRTAASSVGTVGTYAFLGRNVLGSTTIATAGTVVLGSTLEYACTGADEAEFSGTPSGSWRCMGLLKNGTGSNLAIATLFLRVS